MALFSFFKPKPAQQSPRLADVASLDRARALRQEGQLDQALAICQEFLGRYPSHAEALFLTGEIVATKGEPDRALQLFRKVLELQPNHAPAHYKCGNLLKDRQQLDAALASYDRAVALDPKYAYAFCNRGFVLQQLKQWTAALESYDRALSITPQDALAHYNRAAVLRQLERPEDALASYTRAIAAAPGYFQAYCNRGILLNEMSRWDDALADFDRSIELQPDNAEFYLNKAHLLARMKRYPAAIASFDQALALQGNSRYALGARLYAKMSVCEWSGLSADVRRLVSGLEAGQPVSPPVPVLVVVDSVALQSKAAQMWLREEQRPQTPLRPISRRPRPPSGKVRIGYFSCDFHEHPVSMLMAEVIETHDRSRFEVIAFSYGPDSQDVMRKRLLRGFDQFIDVRPKSDRDIALLAREVGVDIAVDLTGHTGDARTGIFALRAAPVQVNYLGYPGTMGADYYDYVIADTNVVPEAHEPYYSEKILRLPHSFLPHDSSRPIAARDFTREELGLPARGFVYCCFNTGYKITPEVFDSWMWILTRVPGSVLWLSQNNEAATGNLRREASSRGVDPARLIFARRMESAAEHLARHRAADLFLDTRPYNAHATAINALYAGLPVLTFPGEGFGSRVAASLLQTLQLTDLIATSTTEYERIAVGMAENSQRHAEVKEKLARNRITAPLFDTQRFTRNLEAGYSRILERFEAGLAPEHVSVRL
jgi:predicted O-linked N-acetylglucosamine transferase (SPINDLY family)